MDDRTSMKITNSTSHQRRKNLTVASIALVAAVGAASTLAFWLYSASRSKIGPIAYLRHPIRQENRFSVTVRPGSRLFNLRFYPESDDGSEVLLASSLRVEEPIVLSSTASSDLSKPADIPASTVNEPTMNVSSPLENSDVRALTFDDDRLNREIMSVNNWQSHIVTVGESVETGNAMAHVWSYLPQGTPDGTGYVANLMRTFELEPIAKARVDMAEEVGAFAISGQTQTGAKIWIGEARSRGIELSIPTEFNHEMSVDSLPTAITFSPDGKTLVTAHENDTVFLWDVQKGEKIQQLTYTVPSLPRSTFDGAVTFSTDGSLVAMTDSSAIYLWESNTGELLNIITLTNEEGTNIWSHTRSLAISNHNQWVVSDAGHRGKIYFWDVVSGELIRILASPTGDHLVFSDDDKQLAVGSDFGEVTLWELPAQLE
ncbi:MAG: hypothetical protein AAFR25_08095 [Cyanobacteria bacterium J06629_19]